MHSFRMSIEQQDQVWQGFKQGKSIASIGRDLDLPGHSARRFLQQFGGIRPAARRRSAKHLSAGEREELSRGLAAGESSRSIAVRLRRSHTTVSREVARNGGAVGYRAAAADQAALDRGLRPKVSKLAAAQRLRVVVEGQLDLDWSPQQISHGLVLDYPDDVSMRVSHESIYLELFTPARRALRRDLVRRLRTGRLMRYPKRPGGCQIKPKIKDMVLLADRPTEVEDRVVGGHWEGDLVMGRRPSAVATLVERRSRLVKVVALQQGIKAPAVRAALVDAFDGVPASMVKTLTWDRGREMAEHVTFTALTHCPVYFCDPRSPWQRGSNENTNGLLRQYLAKNGDINIHDQAALDLIADRLNNRPRAVLGWLTPQETWDKLTEDIVGDIQGGAITG